MKSIYAVLIISLSLSGCIITNTPGFYSGYSRLSPAEKEVIVFTEANSNICNYEDNNKIYAINGLQLSECLKMKEKALVYIWSPNCHADKCYSIKQVQDYCTKNNYELFLITEYYDLSKLNEQGQNLAVNPMLSINEKYYNTRYCNKYYRLFIADLLKNQPPTKTDLYSNFYIFEHGKYITSKLEL